ncbi:MAG: hypothetical protein ACRYFB_05065 [Janthinobacterium lividum]
MDEHIIHRSEEISLKEIIIKFRSARKYIASKWLTILFGGLLGGLLGLSYAYVKKPVYTATSTFVLEDSKSNSLSQYAGLASLAGINVGGSGAGGVFQGDNILELYKSRNMIKQALMSPINVHGQSNLLINLYINFNHLQEKWKKDQNITNIKFDENSKFFTRLQDSVITDISKTINDKILTVTKPDKKLNIIQVDVVTKDEEFSKLFNDKLVQTVNNFYAETKTKKSYQNVLALQKQADSVRRVLNGSINGVASALDAAPNANPSLLTLRVPSQKKQIDVQANTAIYSEIVKNLEISKLSLLQDAPLVQMIDQPVLPLKVDKIKMFAGFIVGLLISCILIILCLTINKLYKLYSDTV